MSEDQVLKLGEVAPVWVPDSDAELCMRCSFKFTAFKRRHHCRACGKVLCAACCSLRASLAYMAGKTARVCVACDEVLNPGCASSETTGTEEDETSEEGAVGGPVSSTPTSPTRPIVVGVLKKDSQRQAGEAKQVIFADGIRPGGDLSEDTAPTRRSTTRRRKPTSSSPRTTEPPLPKPENAVTVIHAPSDFTKGPATFALTKNLGVTVTLVDLDCCVKKRCWLFTTLGFEAVGCDEVVFLLEQVPEEAQPPMEEVFRFIFDLYRRREVVSHLGHWIFRSPFLDGDWGGVMFIRATLQCVRGLLLPPRGIPYLFAILLQKWELPWAKLLPLRVLLRLGAEFRYYPCPLYNARSRKALFYETGNTIVKLLADFRHFAYTLPTVRGLVIQMKEKETVVKIPRKNYADVVKILGNSDEHVLAFGGNFSPDADSHLVCVQGETGNYSTQAINIQNQPRKVTGATFLVFNGALKVSSGWSAKSSIVEDGLMVHVPGETMGLLRAALREMNDFEVGCGPLEGEKEELVVVQWVEEEEGGDKNGLLSPVDGRPLETDKAVKLNISIDRAEAVRWTRLFLIKTDEEDVARIAENIAKATRNGLAPFADYLRKEGMARVGLRVDVGNFSYEAGSNGARLPDQVMNSLDEQLIPVIHRASAGMREGASVVLEFIFHLLEV